MRAKQGLIKSGFLKDQIGLICEERTRREERRGEEEKEEKRKKGDSSQEPSQKGMETTLSMDFVWMLGFWYGTTNLEYGSLVLFD